MRAFLGYGLEESTPDHSSLSVIRQRLGPEIYQGIFEMMLSALKAHGLFRGRHLGIDSSMIEANASLRTLVHRNTEQAYWEYVKELAAEEGIDPEDQGAVRRFDKKRPGRRTSNEEWKNPHDPQAKVGRTKDGACDMIYKPEHVTDLENGAIVQVEVLEGDHADTKALSERVAARWKWSTALSPTSRMASCARSPQTKATLPSRKSPRSKSSTCARSSGMPMLPGVARKL